MRHRAAPPAPRERGFVLVGVMMIVLALTILGLSLFSLSSFEAQFLTRSSAQQRAFYAVSSAIERVKFNLSRTSRLENSYFGIPDAVIDSARAWQWQGGVMRESGPMDGSLVHIRVHARVDDVERGLDGDYVPSLTNDYYRRLITTCGDINVMTPPTGTIWLDGKVYQKGTANSWTTKIHQPPPDSIERNCGWIQPPPVQALFTAHPSPPAPELVTSFTPEWHFDPAGQQLGYFGPPRPLDPLGNFSPAFSFSYVGAAGHSSQFKLKVGGPVVWLLPEGFWGVGEVTIDTLGTPNDAVLVIVAGQNSDPANYFSWGIRMETGLNNPNDVPVILVTSGSLQLNGVNLFSRSISYFSAYVGGDVQFLGGPLLLTLHHDFNAPEDQPGGIVDLLCSWGALPNGGSAVTRLDLIAGSWQESGN